MKRRNALQLIAIGAAATPLAAQNAGHHAASKAVGSTALRFFSPAQNMLVDCISEMIIPADEHSGGASAAGVAAFIDDLVADSDPSVQKAWTDGLAAIDADARSRFGKPFAEAAEPQRDQILAALAENEDDAKTLLERFFVQIKRQTISGYYTSKVGLIDELEYKGGGPQAEFPACKEDHGA
ncbi:MAG: gluconate 2-dehydrogenase subunit 3 family protein [Bryobacterales bacterium]